VISKQINETKNLINEGLTPDVLVLAELEGNDRILCQITSRLVQDKYAIQLDEDDFAKGSLKQRSNIRPNRIFTADVGIILYRIGHLKADKLDEVIVQVVKILEQ